jgi:spore coat protein U-like protein
MSLYKHRMALCLAELFLCLPVHADCRASSLGDVNFGAYDVFSNLPNTSGVGSLTIKCTGGKQSPAVMLSAGQSQNFVTRKLRSGENSLNYNLYTSAARNLVWGDGTGASGVMFANKSHTVVLDMYGSIPEGQDPAVGTYTDNIIVTINF